MLDREDRADQIDAEELLPILRRLLEDRGEAAGEAGIGEEDVEAIMLADGEFDEAGDVLGVSLPADDELGLADLLAHA